MAFSMIIFYLLQDGYILKARFTPQATKALNPKPAASKPPGWLQPDSGAWPRLPGRGRFLGRSQMVQPRFGELPKRHFSMFRLSKTGWLGLGSVSPGLGSVVLEDM